MDNNRADQPEKLEDTEPQILVNDYGATKDPVVVVDEPGRTVMLTEDETVVITKEPVFDIAPKDRPRKVYAGMWGQAEIATVGTAGLAILAAVLIYIFLVVPSRQELEQNRAERDRLEKELMSARAKYGDITSTETQVAKLISSANDFEARYLPIEATGKTALYQRINGLIAGYGLVNTTGPDFTPLETIGQDDQGSRSERGRSRYESLFPGVYMTVTLEGPYQNLRRFIREVETGGEFVVISSVELEPSDSEQKAQPPQGAPPVTATAVNPTIQGANPGFPGVVNQPSGEQPVQVQRAPAPRGKTHGEIVSLRIEMAAYFRRPNAAPLNAEPPVVTQ